MEFYLYVKQEQFCRVAKRYNTINTETTAHLNLIYSNSVPDLRRYLCHLSVTRTNQTPGSGSTFLYQLRRHSPGVEKSHKPRERYNWRH